MVSSLDKAVGMPVGVQLPGLLAENCGVPAVPLHHRGEVHVPVVVQRQVLQSRQRVTAWMDQLTVEMG